MCSNKVLKLKAFAAVLTVAAMIAAVTVSAKRNKKEFVLPDTSAAEIYTNRYAMYKEAEPIQNTRFTVTGYEKKLENANFEIWFSEERADIRIVDKKSGYVWGGIDSPESSDLNEMWAAMAGSVATVEYYDEVNTTYQVSLSDDGVVNNFSYEDNRILIDTMSDDLGIGMTFGIELKDDCIDVYVVPGSIKEESVNKIAKLYILPFFGSTEKAEMDGYFFVPDGSGALIRFTDSGYESSYTAKVYGSDIGIDSVNEVNDLMARRPNDYLVSDFSATVPVYGIVHGNEQFAAFTVINSGAEYAVINASLAGDTMPYNRITAYFEYRQMYNQPVSKTNSIYQPQTKANKVDPRVSIYLLSGKEASYNGMALKYRRILEEEGTLAESASGSSDIPLRLEVIASEVKEGFLSSSTKTLTTVKEMEQMRRLLGSKGINNLTFVLSGWQKGGLNGSRYGSLSLQKSIGSWADIENLRDAVTNSGGKFYLSANMVKLNESQGRLTYLANITISKTLSYYYRDNADIMFPETYVVSPGIAADNVKALAKKLSGYNYNLPGLGEELYSDYKQNRSSARPETEKLFMKTAADVKESGTAISMNMPNKYMWNSCSDYFDIPMMNSQYTMETDSVPFLQIVLKGHIPYYAPYANQGFYRQNCILRTVEYGAYPSFIVMGADNSELSGTPLVDYYSLNYVDWENTVIDTYNKVNSVLKQVENAFITEHKVLSSGVVRVTYDNGAVVYVNYNSEEVKTDGISVPALDFVLKRG